MYLKLHVYTKCKTKANPPFYSRLTSVPNKLGNDAKTDHFLGGSILTRCIYCASPTTTKYYHGYTQWIEEQFLFKPNGHNSVTTERVSYRKIRSPTNVQKDALKLNYFWLPWGWTCNAIRLNKLEFCQNLSMSRYSFPTASKSKISQTLSNI